MKKINWAIIGCGDVAEIKSGPAFQKAKSSALIGVMRRNSQKVKDFAHRHEVPFWTDQADQLLKNEQINAIYVATPPSTHLEYAIKALQARKFVYLEKPMALNAEEASRICDEVRRQDGKLSVAHYRRRLPAFLKVKELIDAQVIGEVQYADIQILQPQRSEIIAQTEENWRLDPAISGGGYFYDLAPHQIDLMYHFFGDIDRVAGSSNRGVENDSVEDLVNGIISFKNNIQFRGIWSFNAGPAHSKDECCIYGTQGKIVFSFYGEEVHLYNNHGHTTFTFKNPPHIQQPFIEAVIDYFLDEGNNPCSAEEGLLVMKTMEQLMGK